MHQQLQCYAAVAAGSILQYSLVCAACRIGIVAEYVTLALAYRGRNTAAVWLVYAQHGMYHTVAAASGRKCIGIITGKGIGAVAYVQGITLAYAQALVYLYKGYYAKVKGNIAVAAVYSTEQGRLCGSAVVCVTVKAVRFALAYLYIKCTVVYRVYGKVGVYNTVAAARPGKGIGVAAAAGICTAAYGKRLSLAYGNLLRGSYITAGYR